ncbi:MAG: hypothetical protein ABSH20_27880 [Tepidisphaeraceae bacterium]|jgi:hypothetical protein
MFVSQTTRRIETLLRQPAGKWLLTRVSGLTSTAKLRSLDVELPLAEVYTGIEFPVDPPLPPRP